MTISQLVMAKLAFDGSGSHTLDQVSLKEDEYRYHGN
jgi:hypothetical protein